MSQSNFYAMLSRMKYINRWGLMNNTRYENISEHSQQVAVLAHCLVLIHNKRFGGNLNPERAALLAVFHDSTEIITGDMPTPVKYANRDIRDIYKDIEDKAAEINQGTMLVGAGLMSKKKFMMDTLGYTEEVAKQELAQIGEESRSNAVEVTRLFGGME